MVFGPKLAIFRTFFLFNIGLKNDFFDILDWKNAFLGNKNKKDFYDDLKQKSAFLGSTNKKFQKSKN